jgi:hypothetical protein
MKTSHLFALLALSVSLTTLPGCSKDPEQDKPAAIEKRPVRTYETRGRITKLPEKPADAKLESKTPATSLLYSIRHERIEKFEDSKGRVSPMRVMVMKFSPAQGVDMSSLKVGDAISFNFEVHWDADPEHILKVTKVSVLPADTKLEFDKPEAPATEVPAAQSPAPQAPASPAAK